MAGLGYAAVVFGVLNSYRLLPGLLVLPQVSEVGHLPAGRRVDGAADLKVWRVHAALLAQLVDALHEPLEPLLEGLAARHACPDNFVLPGVEPLGERDDFARPVPCYEVEGLHLRWLKGDYLGAFFGSAALIIVNQASTDCVL